MGMWPFRRKSQRRKTRGGPDISQSEMHNAGTQQVPARHDGSELAPAGPERRKSRRDTKRKSSRESKKLQRDPEKRDKRRTYSFSPGRNDTIRVARASDHPPVPALPSNLKDKGRAFTEKQGSIPAGTKPLRASTQPPENTQDWQRMPTLHKRSAQEMARRKSDKKRKGDNDREAEIKAMVAFMPTRPAADANSSGRPIRRETRRMRGALNDPSSDISLPLADSLRSSLSNHSEPQTSFVVSALDMLAPRPTIRYSENPRYVPGASGFGSNRSDSTRRRKSERISIPDEVLRANKRVDDLADDLTAGEIRELMERETKRKEKKKIAERIKAEKRLARRQEKQRQDEAEASREGTPPPDNMERGVLGRDVVGLGIGTSAVVTSSKRKSSAGSEDGRGKRPAESFRQDSTTSGQQNTFADFHRSASSNTENLTPGSERSDPVIETATVGTVAKANVSPTLPAAQGHARGQSSISQMMDLTHSEAPQPSTIPEPTLQPAATAPVKTPSSWTSFFKLRSGKNKRPTPPSSFSNTSRDSMHAGQAPTIGYTPMRSTSNVPKRTMSKFREDLPELPISPPDSRVQSPEADVVPPIRTDFPTKSSGAGPSDDPRLRYDTPTSGYRSLEAMRLRDETPTSGRRSTDVPSPEPAAVLSQSLASIDSEGSWLSGRRTGSKRGSSALAHHAPTLDSSSSLNKKDKEFSESAEELGIAEDEYFSRLTPGPEEENMIQRRSGILPSSDDEEGGSISSPVGSENTKWGAIGRQPTVVHREPRAKSREGLLTEFDDDSESEAPSSPTSVDPKDSGLQRATSVDLGKKHVRHISAGSARLLDLKPRSSVDSRRDSARLSSSG
ncbi:uncharacterized protein PAC_14671 [Phialocephala subalpina]|uniref:Uncharacterized protein n=1 Tax=Phialocephala subalpina TaxID=576137 RepID=A0A1L7XIB0_9HELO|nr:uncharacterized protein PAC_14671 [Phialocephala subalpina]